MRIVMIATGPFAAPTLRELYEAGHEVAALVTGPVVEHRGLRAPPSAVRQLAEQHGTPILAPEKINTPDAQAVIAKVGADLLVVCDYGQILSSATLATARQGGINLHGSLLPRYRGAAPINWAIYHGETETGVTVIHMTPQLDAGPCVGQARLAIGPEETAAELETRLSELGAGLVLETLTAMDRGNVTPIPQDDQAASRAPRIKKTDGEIDWSRTAAEIKNHVRAMEPWPKSFTHWIRPDGSMFRMIVGPVVVEAASDPAEPGTVLEAHGDRLVIAAGQGAVRLTAVQPAGKRAMTASEFLRGHPVQAGHRFQSARRP